MLLNNAMIMGQGLTPNLLKQSVAIVGANGYSGVELARILLNHPNADLKACFVRDTKWRLSHEIFDKKAESVSTLNFHDLIPLARDFKFIFLATPIEVSLELVPRLVAQTKIIDLSGAFRLSEAHEAHYGLIPWNTGQNSSLVSNPGCYATSCLMALIPLLKNKLVDPSNIVIDAKSGTTGAGRSAKENLLFSEVSESCLPYKIGIHQHLPEIKKYADFFSGANTDIQLTTHLLPIRRGIISSIYLKRHSQFSLESEAKYLSSMTQAYEEFYGKEPLVRFGSVDDNSKLLSLRAVVGSPRTHISYVVRDQKIFVFSCIDNLLKGAASQAVENWNAQNQWSTDLGLEQIEGTL